MTDFDNICFEITSNESKLSLEEKLQKLNDLKKHIKKDCINISLINEYFNLIFTILNQKSLKYEKFINTAYSILCYLIKRIYMQDKSNLVYNTDHEYLNDCLVWLSIKCDTDNNSKKALYCLYSVQQQDVFIKMLCNNVNKFINVKNMLRFVFESVIEGYHEADYAKVVSSYDCFFELLDIESKEYVQKWKTKLNINDSANSTNSNNLLEKFMSLVKSSELQNHNVDSGLFKERHFNNTPTFNRYMKNTFDQGLFEGKESEINWTQRLNYLTSMIVNIQKFKDECIITDTMLINVLKCSTSLRTSLTLHALKFFSLLFDNPTSSIAESTMIKIMMQMYQLIQTNKKILFNAEHEVFCKSIEYYIKSKYSSMKLFKIINLLCSDKNILSVTCSVDYLTLIYLCVDKYITGCQTPTKRELLYTQRLNSQDVDTYQTYMNDIDLARIKVPIGIYLFKKLLGNSSGQVKVKLRKNFWEHMSHEMRNTYFIQYLDAIEIKKVSIGYEHELSKFDDANNYKIKATQINGDRSYRSVESQIKQPSTDFEILAQKTKRNDENDVYLDDLELLDIDILPQYEMTMIPFKKRKTLFDNEKENIDTRVSSGETYVATKSEYEGVNLSCPGINNINSIGFSSFEKKCIDFLDNSDESNRDNKWNYFLNKNDLKLSFKLIILMNDKIEYNEQIEAFIRNTFSTLENNAAMQIDTLSELLLISKLCKKLGLNPMDYTADVSLYRFIEM